MSKMFFICIYYFTIGHTSLIHNAAAAAVVPLLAGPQITSEFILYPVDWTCQPWTVDWCEKQLKKKKKSGRSVFRMFVFYFLLLLLQLLSFIFCTP